MKTKAFLSMLPVAAALALTGCIADSISGNGSAFYKGELHDADVIGPVSGSNSDADILRELNRSSGGRVRPVAGSRFLLVQSGAPQPDPALQAAFAGYGDPQSYTGVPEGDDDGTADHKLNSRKLRMAAARAGARTIIVVLGQLETEGGDVDGGLLGELPVVNAVVPTHRSVTRLRLKAMVVDTASGRWSTTVAEPLHAGGLTTSYANDASRTVRYEKLKAAAYPELARKVFAS